MWPSDQDMIVTLQSRRSMRVAAIRILDSALVRCAVLHAVGRRLGVACPFLEEGKGGASIRSTGWHGLSCIYQLQSHLKAFASLRARGLGTVTLPALWHGMLCHDLLLS